MNSKIICFFATVVLSIICIIMAVATGDTEYFIGGVVYNAATLVIISMGDK